MRSSEPVSVLLAFPYGVCVQAQRGGALFVTRRSIRGCRRPGTPVHLLHHSVKTPGQRVTKRAEKMVHHLDAAPLEHEGGRRKHLGNNGT